MKDGIYLADFWKVNGIDWVFVIVRDGIEIGLGAPVCNYIYVEKVAQAATLYYPAFLEGLIEL